MSAVAGRAEFLAHFAVSRETAARFDTYAGLLAKWQGAINLVAPATLEAVWTRHFLDSAQLLPHLGAVPVIDLGSGAGFPGLVLAMLGAADVHLVESDQRKAAFLREVARATGTAITIHNARIEALDADLRVGTIVARALAPLSQLFALTEILWQPGTIGLFPKGRSWQDELTAAQALWNMTADALPSLTEAESAILRIKDLSPKP